MTIINSSSLACELFKACRDRWLTRAEIGGAIGASEVAVSNWVDEFVAQGILKMRTRYRPPGKSGYAAKEFTLAPEWIGPRLAPPQDGSDQASASVRSHTEKST